MAITVKHYREILDELEISHIFHKDAGIIEFILHETEPFEADYKILVNISEERELIQINGILCEKDLDDANDFEAAYRFCNQWHADTTMPKVVVNTGGKFLSCEWSWDTDFEMSDVELKMMLAKFIHGTKLCIIRAADMGLYHFEKKADDTQNGLLSRFAGFLPGRK